MRLAHDSYYRDLLYRQSIISCQTLRAYTTSSPDRPGFQFGQKSLLVLVRNSADDINKSWDASKPVFLAHLRSQDIEGNGFVRIVRFDKLRCYARGDSQKLFSL